MNRRLKPCLKTARRHRCSGVALIAGLVFLLIVTILGLSIFQNSGLQTRMAGSFREKGRAFESAFTALQYGEWWLSQAALPLAATCTGMGTSPVVCNNALAAPTTIPWTVGTTYTPPGMTVATSGIGTYTQIPAYYIQYVGLNPQLSGTIYRVTGLGYGGNANAVAVVQSTYVIASTYKNLGK